MPGDRLRKAHDEPGPGRRIPARCAAQFATCARAVAGRFLLGMCSDIGVRDVTAGYGRTESPHGGRRHPVVPGTARKACGTTCTCTMSPLA